MTTRRPSKAEIRRRKRELQTETPAPPLPSDIAEKVTSYTPRELDPARWRQIRPFVIDVVARYEPSSEPIVKQRLTAVSAFADWAVERGYELDRKSLLTAERIDAFIATADLGPSASKDYRSRLRGIMKKVNRTGSGATVSVSVPHRAVQPPYNAAEIAAIARIARTQPSDVIRRQMCACVGLGLGAGLDSVDLKPMYGRHIADHGDAGIELDVPGQRPRTVWVRAEFEELVRFGIAGVSADQLVVGVDPDRRNVAGKIFENAHILGDAPHFEQSRMRTTWLASLLVDRVPMPVIMDAAGLVSARTITDLVPMLDVDVDVAAELRGADR